MKERTIVNILKGFQKMELEDLGSILGSDLPRRLKKARQVELLADYLTLKPKRWMSHLMERDIRLLKSLVHSGPDKVQYMDYPDYPSLLEVSGLVDYDDSDGHFHKVWLRREVYDIVAPHVDQVIQTGEKSGRFEIERVGLGYLNLYGILPTGHFVDLMMDYYEARYGKDFDDLVGILHQSPLIKLCRYTDRHGDYVCSPCVSGADELFELRETVPGDADTFRPFNFEEALEAGAGAPYFTVGLKTPEGRALVDMLQGLGYEGFELVKVEHDIWVESQAPLLNDSLFEPVDRRGDSIPSVHRYQSCLDIVAAYANSVPKWALNGFSAEERDFLIVEAPTFTEEAVADDEGQPRWTMPRPTISEGYIDIIETDAALDRLSALMPQGFPFGLAIPHVALEDPCPCGSGLKYGHCHGKNMN
ncbi:MAG: SEC-C domain-containing protein [Bacteroidales bacterium]|nr:SEC-C domain-containing protein [Bacteroidales bacterium]